MQRTPMFGMNRRQLIGSALPPVLIGLGISLESLVYDWAVTFPLTWRVLVPVLALLLPGLAVGIIGLTALVRRLPLWGISWVGSFLMGATLFTKVTVEELVDDGSLVLSPTMDFLLAAGFFLAGLAFLLLVARSGWQRAGLFTLAAASIFGLSLLQSLLAAPLSRAELAVWAGPLGLIFGSLLYLYCSRSWRVQWGVIGAAGLLNVGLVFAANAAWGERLVARSQVSPLIPLIVLITGVLLSGPITGLLLQRRQAA